MDFLSELKSHRKIIPLAHDDSDRATSDEPDRTDLLSRSFRFLGGELKGTADETLFLELALRGYDLSKLQDNETTAKIVKIG